MNNATIIKRQMKGMKVRGLSIILNGYVVVRVSRSEWRVGEVGGDWLTSGPLELIAQRVGGRAD